MKRRRGSTPQNLRRRDPKNEQRAKNNQRHKRRRKRSRAVFAALILLFIVAVIVTLSLTVFFKTEKIEVFGETQYGNEEIVAGTGVKLGDNLIGISAGDVQSRILNSFPLVDTAEVTKNLPGTLTIKLTPAVPSFAIENEGSYFTLSKSFRVMEVGNTQLAGVTLITGAEMKGIPEKGDVLAFKDARSSQYLNTIASECEVYGLTALRGIDVSDLGHIVANYEDRINVEFGDSTQLQYKAQLAFHVIKNNIQASEKGTVDAAIIGEVHFLPDR